ncbi:MAG: peptide chain release factor N(5)-glutamine methyltransferase [Comamonas sp.]|nr:peptide chain release factor N(5)-glutamine methyltransferase [Comamonas sp.]
MQEFFSQENKCLSAALRWAAQQKLPRLEAQMLLLHCLGRSPQDRAWLLTHDDECLTATQAANFQALCQRRLQGEPMAYLTGEKEFFGLPLQVDKRVLDPRPDTETLGEWALELLPPASPARVADLGTGSGAIALAIQSQRPQASVTAVDASAAALEVASANAQRLQLPVQCVQSSWLEQVQGRFDLIVSNPPYIREDDPHLPALHHEPRQALTSGADGLEDIRRIATQAPAHLEAGGWLLLEHGWNQAEAVQGILQAAGFQAITSRRDLGGQWRCTGGMVWGSTQVPIQP